MLVDLGVCGLMLVVLSYDWNLARAEAAAAGTGISHPGSFLAADEEGEASEVQLGRDRASLERSLRLRPDWAEGYHRLGLVNLKLYEMQAARLLGPDAAADDELKRLADPLWLHGVVHSATEKELAEFGGVVDQEPVRRCLAPAARAFLQARRCCPFRAPAHAHLASLDYLVDGGESVSAHASRALRLSGGDPQVTMLAAVVASQAGELDVAAPALRRTLQLRGSEWATIADLAGAIFEPEETLDAVLPPDAGYEIRFADRLYADPKDRAARDLFLRAALERAGGNVALTPAEVRWLQGQAWARLGEREQARRAMDAALALEAARSDRREEYARWLLEWGLADEANTPARIGLGLDPEHDGLRKSLAKAVDAMARGGSSVAAGPQTH